MNNETQSSKGELLQMLFWVGAVFLLASAIYLGTNLPPANERSWHDVVTYGGSTILCGVSGIWFFAGASSENFRTRLVKRFIEETSLVLIGLILWVTILSVVSVLVAEGDYNKISSAIIVGVVSLLSAAYIKSLRNSAINYVAKKDKENVQKRT